MRTPICDFARQYAESDALRLHMPGHKGSGALGVEHLDLTEIAGADSLYEASGIIRESEENASSLFGCPTYYSTEGSSQCIRAMLYLAALWAKEKGMGNKVLAGRNAHKTFISACALLGLDVKWLCSAEGSYLSCDISAAELDEVLSSADEKPMAVYLTSPDYLGNTLDIAAIAQVCHKHDTLLVVDNAHGAYLRFLEKSQHPIDLGADLCCDSAHKTLPVLTGGAYMHISSNLPEMFCSQAKNALALFGSTSPSYLIMQSLDAANAYMADGYREKLSDFLVEISGIKTALSSHGYELIGNEPMKITIAAKSYGCFGYELGQHLLEKNIVGEFSDRDYMVLMLTPEIGADGLMRLKNTLLSIPRKAVITEKAPEFSLPERVMSIRQALFSLSESIPAQLSEGRILATANVGCPPAVPIVVSGERIDENAVKCFEYYGIDTVDVIKKEDV